MPLYQFKCRNCGDECEYLIMRKGDKPKCHCGHSMKQVPTAPAMGRVKGYNEKNGYSIPQKNRR